MTSLLLAAPGCDAITGIDDDRELWSMRELGPAVGTPLVAGDLVVAGVSESNVVYAVDRATGDLIWQTPLQLPPSAIGLRELVPSTEFHAWKDQVIVSAGWVHSLDRATGEVIWSLAPTGRRPGRWAVLGDGILFAAGSHITAIDPDTGAILHNIYLGEFPFAPIYDDGILYFGARGVVGETSGGYSLGAGHAMAVDASSGEILWQVPVPDHLPWVGGVVDRGVLTDDLFVVAGMNGRVYGIDRDSGEIRWLHKARTPISAQVQLLDDVVVVGGSDGVVQGIDADSGALLWENGDLSGSITAIGKADRAALVTHGRIRAIDAEGRELCGYGGYAWEEPTTLHTPTWKEGAVYITSEIGLLAVEFP